MANKAGVPASLLFQLVSDTRLKGLLNRDYTLLPEYCSLIKVYL